MSNRGILRALIKAKKDYINAGSAQLGMCYHISKFMTDVYVYPDIHLIIPEFTPEFLCTDENFGYWWDIDNNISRIVAFDKLISIYKKKCSLWDRFLALF